MQQAKKGAKTRENKRKTEQKRRKKKQVKIEERKLQVKKMQVKETQMKKIQAIEICEGIRKNSVLDFLSCTLVQDSTSHG